MTITKIASCQPSPVGLFNAVPIDRIVEEERKVGKQRQVVILSPQLGECGPSAGKIVMVIQASGAAH
ncbi:MAG: hypothetical protein CO149_07500 [Nitrospirae bacterium CG_4_9_14_3_um_filter_51_5]|nr:MAG: hypothetical protein CO149_07500 [Nitrospirae bacterium CG_4_9_14_3_um_filter_51_5]